MPESKEREIPTVLFYERNVKEGKPIAAVAWEGEDWAISPARDAPPLGLVRIRARLGRPIEERIDYLRSLGYATPTTLVNATDTTEAARVALRIAGLRDEP